MTPSRSKAHPALLVQTLFLSMGTVAYWVYSVQYVPDHLGRPVIGTLVIAAAYVISQRLGANHKPGVEPVLVFGLTMLIFFVAPADGPPPRAHSFVAAVIGAFVAQGSWALFRYPYEATRQAHKFLRASLFARVRGAAKFGIIMAFLLTLFVAVLLIIAGLADKQARSISLLHDFVLVSVGYLGGGILGGAVIGAFAPVVRWPLGAMLLGIPLAGACYGSFAVAMHYMEMLNEGTDPATAPPLAALLVLVCIGPMWGIMAKEWIED